MKDKNGVEITVGAKVRYDGFLHAEFPRSHPKAGTVGTVLKIVNGMCLNFYVKWPDGSTSENDKWWANGENLEVVE